MEKLIVYISMVAGALVGAQAPVVVLGASTFSWISLGCGILGGLLGVWLGWRLTSWVDD